MLVVYIMSNGSPEQNLRQIFKLLDIDNDGCVSISEFKKVIKDIYRLASYKTQMDGIIQVWDWLVYLGIHDLPLQRIVVGHLSRF